MKTVGDLIQEKLKMYTSAGNLGREIVYHIGDVSLTREMTGDGEYTYFVNDTTLGVFNTVTRITENCLWCKRDAYSVFHLINENRSSGPVAVTKCKKISDELFEVSGCGTMFLNPQVLSFSNWLPKYDSLDTTTFKSCIVVKAQISGRKYFRLYAKANMSNSPWIDSLSDELRIEEVRPGLCMLLYGASLLPDQMVHYYSGKIVHCPPAAEFWQYNTKHQTIELFDLAGNLIHEYCARTLKKL